jgi:hypothetical protein
MLGYLPDQGRLFVGGALVRSIVGARAWEALEGKLGSDVR